MARGARELIDGVAVPIEPEPGEPVEDRGDRGVGGTFAVGVLDAQQHLPAGVAGIEPVEQRRAAAADMQKSGGEGAKRVMMVPDIKRSKRAGNTVEADAPAERRASR